MTRTRHITIYTTDHTQKKKRNESNTIIFFIVCWIDALIWFPCIRSYSICCAIWKQKFFKLCITLCVTNIIEIKIMYQTKLKKRVSFVFFSGSSIKIRQKAVDICDVNRCLGSFYFIFFLVPSNVQNGNRSNRTWTFTFLQQFQLSFSFFLRMVPIFCWNRNCGHSISCVLYTAAFPYRLDDVF